MKLAPGSITEFIRPLDSSWKDLCFIAVLLGRQALSFTHELSFFLFYQSTALRSRAVGGRQMYSGGSVVQSTHP